MLNQTQKLNVTLKKSKPYLMKLLFASRTPERVLESPVTIERMGIADIKSLLLLFYDGLEKEVQMNTSSLSLSL
jgi:hypothetical protein